MVGSHAQIVNVDRDRGRAVHGAAVLGQVAVRHAGPRRLHGLGALRRRATDELDAPTCARSRRSITSPAPTRSRPASTRHARRRARAAQRRRHRHARASRCATRCRVRWIGRRVARGRRLASTTPAAPARSPILDTDHARADRAARRRRRPSPSRPTRCATATTSAPITALQDDRRRPVRRAAGRGRRRRHRAGRRSRSRSARRRRSARSAGRDARPTRRPPPRPSSSTAGDATLTVGDAGPLANGAFTLAAAARGARRRRRPGPRPITNDTFAIDFQQKIAAERPAAHRHLQPDADVHAFDFHSVACTPARPRRSGPRTSWTRR